MTKTFGIVGFGQIGMDIARAVEEGRLKVPLAGVTSRSEAPARERLARLKNPPPYCTLDELIERADLLVEAAGQQVVPELARRVFAAGKDLLVISVGALLNHPELMEQARAKNCRLILPSGAIAAVDGIKSACQGRVDHVTITTRKPPRGLQGAPWLREQKIDLSGITEETEVYHGPVREACRGFPENVNVSATISLAGLGPDRTMIRILAVPGLERNRHTVEVAGEFGELTMHISNIPSENPKTGRLTAMSMIRAIADAMDTVRIGN